jgi:hypothetical protein
MLLKDPLREELIITTSSLQVTTLTMVEIYCACKINYMLKVLESIKIN